MRKSASLNGEILGQIAFIVAFLLLLGCWLVVQHAGFRARIQNRNACQLLDVELLPRQSETPAGKVCRVVIRIDERVRYTIRKPEEDAEFLIDLPHTQAAPGLVETLPSNELVQRIWLDSSGGRVLTVGLDLSSPDVRVADLSSSGLNGVREINLELRGPETLPPVPAKAPTITHQRTPVASLTPVQVAYKRQMD
jgi:hypothetical protein